MNEYSNIVSSAVVSLIPGYGVMSVFLLLV